MGQRIVIDPVTRIEGHAKISLILDDQGEVSDARFHVVEFRGFEKFCEGRSFREMPGITSRVCGICPVSHMLTSAKAGDELLAVEIPEGATRLRRLIHYGQILQSHALSLLPPLLARLPARPRLRPRQAQRHGPDRRQPRGRAARDPAAPVRPGDHRDARRQEDPPGVGRAGRRRRAAHRGGPRPHPQVAARGEGGDPKTLTFWKREMDRHQDEARVFGNFPSLFMGLVTPDGGLEHYDGKIRFVDATGQIVADQLDRRRSTRSTSARRSSPGRTSSSRTTSRSATPAACTASGPLARLNVASHCGTPLADRELAEFRQLGRGAVLSSFHYHYARLIEILLCVERIEELVDDPEICTTHVIALARRNRYEGVGCCEAPRGTLFHHYKVRQGGLISWANLIIATGQNNLAMNQTVLQIARHYVKGDKLKEGMLNRVEAGIRAYDPCLSCSTHAYGEMPLVVELRAADGTLLDTVARG